MLAISFCTSAGNTIIVIILFSICIILFIVLEIRLVHGIAGYITEYFIYLNSRQIYT